MIHAERIIIRFSADLSAQVDGKLVEIALKFYLKMSFEGKVILIVNGEVEIGILAAEYFAAEKAKLALASTNDDRKCKSLLQQIKDSGIEMDAFIIIDDLDSKCIIDKTIETFGRLDILFINAFFEMPASIENLSMRDFDAVLAKNIRNPIELTHFAVPHLAKSRGNVIIVNSNALGLIPLENWIYYCISKAALHQFVKCAAIELKHEAIRINS